MLHFYEIVKDRIHHGQYPLGAKLASEQALAEEFNISKSYVHKQLQKLVEEGYLHCKHKSGYHVVERSSSAPASFRIALIGGEDDWNENGNGLLWTRAREFGMLMEQYPAQRNETLNELLRVLIEEKHFHGAIIHATVLLSWGHGMARALHEHFPVMLIGHQINPAVFPAVCMNQFEAGFIAAKHLSFKGYATPLFWGYLPEVNDAAQLKQMGFSAGCEYYGLKPQYLYSFPDGNLEPIDRLISQGGFDSIFASTRSFSHASMRYFLMKNLIPCQNGCPGFIGLSAPKVFPEQSFIADCIMENYDANVEESLKLMSQIVLTRSIASVKSVFTTPQYQAGQTLLQRGKT